MKKSNLFILILIGILSLATVYAVTGIRQTDIFYDGSTLNPVTTVQEILYTCSDSTCSTQGNLIHNLNTGSSNSITFEYPYNPSSTQSNPDYYSHFSFAQCYLPKEYKEWVWGYGETVQYDYHMNKVESCYSPIDSFSITNSNYANEPVVINMEALLDATATSAFTDLQLNWFPLGYEDYYSVETRVTLEILDSNNNIVYTEIRNLNILMDTSQNIQFTWTPTIEGEYTAKISTDVTDCQCSGSIQQFSQKEFTVWEERPQDECYTILNDLVASPHFAEEGEEITVTFTKISNYADDNYNKLPVKTKANYQIIKDSQIVYNKDIVLNANPDSVNPKEFSFKWTPDSGGDYAIKVSGICESVLCEGKTNPEDTIILGYYVTGVDVTEKYNVEFIAEDCETNEKLDDVKIELGSEVKFTDIFGEAIFNQVLEGVYFLNVSKENYYSESDDININSDQLIEFCLNKKPIQDNQSITDVSIIYPNGGEKLKDIIGVLWNATNSLNHELVIYIEYSINSGINWINLASGLTNTGSYLWNTNTVSDDDYLLKVCAEDSITTEIVCDISDGNFEINNSEVIPAVCGNGILEIGETCDSNSIICSILGYSGTQLCNSQCNGWNLCVTTQYCGDEVINGNESCDDGMNNGNYGYCKTDCTGVGSSCGDGILNLNYENCDDGNNLNGDRCSSTCKIEQKNNNGGSKEEECYPVWECSGWSECYDGIKTRICKDLDHCDTLRNKPAESIFCEDYSLEALGFTGESAIGLGGNKSLSRGINLTSIIMWGLIIAIVILLLIMIVRLLIR
ncbi:MAG: hypothetical protein KKF67_01030 [Nanoarchaeota archaeon]|nr:hypothetical protein [Nanoarchaeota archaeon]